MEASPEPDPVAALDHGVDGGEEVEGDGNGVEVVVVVDPGGGARELPLHVGVALDAGERRGHQRDQQIQHDEDNKNLLLDEEEKRFFVIFFEEVWNKYPAIFVRTAC